MNRLRRHVLAAVVSVTMTVSVLYSQVAFEYNAEAEKVFTLGVNLFEKGKYQDAETVFRGLITLTPLHQRTTAAYLMAAKSSIRLEDFGGAVSLLKEYLQQFPGSSYVDDAHYSLGIAYMMTRQYYGSVTEFLRVIERGRNDSLAKDSEGLTQLIAALRLSAPALRGLLQEASTRRGRDLLTLILAEKYQRDGDRNRSELLLQQIVKRQEPSPFKDRATAMLRALSKTRSLKIGVMLPLMNEFPSSPARPLAQEMLDGISEALDEYEEAGDRDIEIALEVRDTERDTVVTMRTIQDFSSDKEVVAVVGPMFSTEAFAAGRVAKGIQLPMISPTANARGIAAQSPYVFQANPDLSLHGRAIARYAVQNLHLQSLAILAPDDENARAQVDAFADEAERLGADIIAREAYGSTSDNLEEIFMRLRGMGVTEPTVTLARGMSKRELRRLADAGADSVLLDSLKIKGGTVNIYRLFGPSAKQIADSLKLPYKVPHIRTQDLTEPLKSIDGLFVPLISSDDIGAIASQVSYYNIRTQLLGSAEWNDLSHLESNKRYLKGVVFCSDSYIDKSDSAYRSFEEHFAQSKKYEPTKYSLFGYDTMNLLLHVIEEGAITREGIARGLNDVRRFPGLRTSFTLTHNRVNDIIHILKYDGTSIVKLEEMEVR